VYCGKMADWIQMPFGCEWSRDGMGVLYFGDNRRRGKGSFVG